MNKTTFSDLFHALVAASRTSHDKGVQFEHLMKRYLTADPQHGQLPRQDMTMTRVAGPLGPDISAAIIGPFNASPMTQSMRFKNPILTPFSPPPAGALKRRWRTKPSRSRDCGSRKGSLPCPAFRFTSAKIHTQVGMPKTRIYLDLKSSNVSFTSIDSSVILYHLPKIQRLQDIDL